MAAGGTTTNVQLGPGRLWLAPIGSTEPTSASAAPDGAFSAMGYTEEGSEVAIESTVDEVEVAEELDPILYVNSKRTTMLTVALAETTRMRLAMAMGHGSEEADSAESLEPPTTGSEVGVMLIWDSEEDSAANADNVRWVFRQAKPSGNVSIARKKSPDKSTIPIEFKIEKPSGSAPFIVFPNSAGLI